jgi:hypothetical protein
MVYIQLAQRLTTLNITPSRSNNKGNDVHSPLKMQFLTPFNMSNQGEFVYQTYVIVATMKTKMTMLNPMRMICNGI